MDFSVEEYLKTILADADIPDEQAEVLKSVLARDEVSAKVKDTVLMRSDYSRRMDEISRERKELEEIKRKENEFYEKQLSTAYNNQQRYEQLLEERDELRKALEGSSKAGDDDFWSTPEPPKANGLSEKQLERKLAELRAEYQAQLAQLQESALDVIADTTLLAQKHNREFGEDLNPKELFSFAVKNKLPMEHAYNEFTAAKRQELYEQKQKEAIKRARDEGYRDAISKHHLPTDDRPRGIHALRPPKDIPKTAKDRVDAAVNDFMRGTMET